mmetsp:Transcript_43376/g.139418  ORF Transcript_43376/g.139418 Transcript_43376/m.139418 type:complete len:227 (+) Transcript_43376:251-931(+)|eukprot:CAMPEP_0203948336 /NCGR_PEP_ID=MMETSP0359-20131031/83009_1 /ASSEMBLY_ACC=CAM_ASM_000338 /TAXON_ID=268821 /ORGANISM="Scrippsiella Hangoei, Strain SHTV-5" /LENGTH=226 /DNA_ID=CAMNT_0050879853 /DNA_START=186 /DNA_END=866 /DNA_ORIENTATION=-
MVPAICAVVRPPPLRGGNPASSSSRATESTVSNTSKRATTAPSTRNDRASSSVFAQVLTWASAVRNSRKHLGSLGLASYRARQAFCKRAARNLASLAATAPHVRQMRGTTKITITPTGIAATGSTLSIKSEPALTTSESSPPSVGSSKAQPADGKMTGAAIAKAAGSELACLRSLRHRRTCRSTSALPTGSGKARHATKLELGHNKGLDSRRESDGEARESVRAAS